MRREATRSKVAESGSARKDRCESRVNGQIVRPPIPICVLSGLSSGFVLVLSNAVPVLVIDHMWNDVEFSQFTFDFVLAVFSSTSTVLRTEYEHEAKAET